MEPKNVMLMPLALHIFKDFEARWARFEEEKDEYYREGYRPQYCFHGTNLWVDYDPICQACEDGYGWFDRQAYRRLSLDIAFRECAEWDKRVALLTALKDANAPVEWGTLLEWAAEPITKYGVYEAMRARQKLDPQF